MGARAGGFTLLELLIAMAVFSTLAALAYTGLNQVLRTQTQLEASAERLTERQLAHLQLQRDLHQPLSRLWYTEFGEPRPPLYLDGRAATPRLRLLVRSGYPGQAPQRVAWTLEPESGQLLRQRWPAPSATGAPLSMPQLRHTPLRELRWEFHYRVPAPGGGRQWQQAEQWPPLNPQAPPRPQAVTLHLVPQAGEPWAWHIALEAF